MYNITYLYRVQKSISRPIVLQFGPIQIKVSNKVHINKLDNKYTSEYKKISVQN